MVANSRLIGLALCIAMSFTSIALSLVSRWSISWPANSASISLASDGMAVSAAISPRAGAGSVGSPRRRSRRGIQRHGHVAR